MLAKRSRRSPRKDASKVRFDSPGQSQAEYEERSHHAEERKQSKPTLWIKYLLAKLISYVTLLLSRVLLTLLKNITSN